MKPYQDQLQIIRVTSCTTEHGAKLWPQLLHCTAQSSFGHLEEPPPAGRATTPIRPGCFEPGLVHNAAHHLGGFHLNCKAAAVVVVAAAAAAAAAART
jgi:hypothetical protein